MPCPPETGRARNFQKPEFEIGNHGVEVLDGIKGERQFRVDHRVDGNLVDFG